MQRYSPGGGWQPDKETDMTSLARKIELCQREIGIFFVHASGPGGQNVNKVATTVQLRFDIGSSKSLDAESKMRLVQLGGKRVTDDGVLLMRAGRYRTQAGNREEVLRRFSDLLARSLVPPKTRHKTKPSASSKEQRLRAKLLRGKIKKTRRNADYE